MNTPLRTCVFGALAYAACAPAQAVTVAYAASPLGGNHWEYNYTITNDDLTVAIEEFTIYFELGLFELLDNAAGPADWDVAVAQPDADLPDDGFFDGLALSGGIAPGEVLAGFTVQFDFLGEGTPGPQFFEIVDPATFDVLASGGTVPVPLPPAALLLASALAGLGVPGRRGREAR